MATSTIYFLNQIWIGKGLKRISYEFHKQIVWGNTKKAKDEKKNLEKEYPKPNFIIKRRQGYLTIYKK